MPSIFPTQFNYIDKKSTFLHKHRATNKENTAYAYIDSSNKPQTVNGIPEITYQSFNFIGDNSAPMIQFMGKCLYGFGAFNTPNNNPSIYFLDGIQIANGLKFEDKLYTSIIPESDIDYRSYGYNRALKISLTATDINPSSGQIILGENLNIRKKLEVGVGPTNKDTSYCYSRVNGIIINNKFNILYNDGKYNDGFNTSSYIFLGLTDDTDVSYNMLTKEYKQIQQPITNGIRLGLNSELGRFVNIGANTTIHAGFSVAKKQYNINEEIKWLDPSVQDSSVDRLEISSSKIKLGEGADLGYYSKIGACVNIIVNEPNSAGWSKYIFDYGATSSKSYLGYDVSIDNHIHIDNSTFKQYEDNPHLTVDSSFGDIFVNGIILSNKKLYNSIKLEQGAQLGFNSKLGDQVGVILKIDRHPHDTGKWSMNMWPYMKYIFRADTSWPYQSELGNGIDISTINDDKELIISNLWNNQPYITIGTNVKLESNVSIGVKDITNWNNKVTKVTGKGLSTNDFTASLKTGLNTLISNYLDTSGNANIKKKVDSIYSLLNEQGVEPSVIDTYAEIKNFLKDYSTDDTLKSVIDGIKINSIISDYFTIGTDYENLGIYLKSSHIPAQYNNNYITGDIKIITKPSGDESMYFEINAKAAEADIMQSEDYGRVIMKLTDTDNPSNYITIQDKAFIGGESYIGFGAYIPENWSPDNIVIPGIGKNVNIESSVNISSNLSIWNTATSGYPILSIGGDINLGTDVTINASVNIDTSVNIEKNVEIGANTTIDNAISIEVIRPLVMGDGKIKIYDNAKEVTGNPVNGITTLEGSNTISTADIFNADIDTVKIHGRMGSGPDNPSTLEIGIKNSAAPLKIIESNGYLDSPEIHSSTKIFSGVTLGTGISITGDSTGITITYNNKSVKLNF